MTKVCKKEPAEGWMIGTGPGEEDVVSVSQRHCRCESRHGRSVGLGLFGVTDSPRLAQNQLTD